MDTKSTSTKLLNQDEATKSNSNVSEVAVKPLFKTKKPRSGNLRVKATGGSQRSTGGWDEEGPAISAVVPKEGLENRKRARQQPEGKEEVSLLPQSKVTVLYKADVSTTLQSAHRELVSGATATTNIDGELEIEEDQNSKEVVAATTDSVYAGKKGYNTYLTKREGTGDSKKKTGPIRAPSHLRVTTRFDYAPDICKDYKETGFCGYGDSCKFLHDRGDYKSGWQIDQEWDLEQAAKREEKNRQYRKFETGEEDTSSESEQEEEMPFACLICRLAFVNPVVTKCGHYFCEACALKSYAKTPKCQACGAGTQGLFDTATKLIERLKNLKPNESEPDPTESESPHPVIELGQDTDSSEP